MPHWERLAVRAMGSVETELTVLGREQITPTYLRLQMSDGGLLSRRDAHPTMWLRLWFDDDGRDHQRAFTLVDPDPRAGTFFLEFALHDGVACDWARTCAPGDTVRASLLGSRPPWETPRRRADGRRSGSGETADGAAGRTVLIGDCAALPAINSLLGDLEREARAQGRSEVDSVEVWLEHRLPQDRDLPVRAVPGASVRRVHRTGPDTGVAAALARHWAEAPPRPQDRFWIALEAADTRELGRVLRGEHGVERTELCATAYWKAA